MNEFKINDDIMLNRIYAIIKQANSALIEEELEEGHCHVAKALALLDLRDSLLNKRSKNEH